MRRAALGAVALAAIAALAWYASSGEQLSAAMSEEAPVSRVALAAAPAAPPAPAARPRDRVPAALLAGPPKAAQAPRPSDADATAQRALEPIDVAAQARSRMAARVEADARFAPFLRAAREIGLDGRRQELLLALLALKSGGAPTNDAAAAARDPGSSMRRRAEALRDLIHPLASIAGPDLSRLIAAAMRPAAADFAPPAAPAPARF